MTGPVALAALALVVGEEPRASDRIAILPVSAERVTADDVAQLRKLDELMRRAAAEVHAGGILDEPRTVAELRALEANGIACDVADDACLGKVAVLLEVDRLAVPLVRFERDRTWLRVRVVDASSRGAQAERASTAPASFADVKAVLSEALAAAPGVPVAPVATVPPTAPAMTAPPPPTTTTAAPPTTTTAAVEPEPAPPVVDERPPAPLFIAGASAAAGGAVVALAGGAGAFALNEALVAREPWDARVAKIAAGQALLYVAILGGVAAVTGGVLLGIHAADPG